MTKEAARLWITKASLILTLALLVLFLAGPYFFLRIRMTEALYLVAVIGPIFTGYASSAALSLLALRKSDQAALRDQSAPAANPLLLVLVKWPIYIFSVATLCVLAAFIFSNRVGSTPPRMSFDALFGAITAILALLPVTTNVSLAYAFSES